MTHMSAVYGHNAEFKRYSRWYWTLWYDIFVNCNWVVTRWQ